LELLYTFFTQRARKRDSWSYFSPMRGSLHRRSKRNVTPIVWTLRAEAPRDPDKPNRRVQKTTTFKGTKAQAEDALIRFIESVRLRLDTDGQITFDQLFESWRKEDSTREKPRAATTVHQDLLRYNKWIRPKFGALPVVSVRPITISNFYSEIRRDRIVNNEIQKGLGANSVVRVHALLAAMTNWGFRQELLAEDPMKHVKKPRSEKMLPRAPKAADVDALLNHLWKTDRRMWLAVRLASSLALRRSEILALKWTDFLVGHLDEEEGELAINRGMVKVPEYTDMVETDTKSGVLSHRRLRMDKELTSEIRELVMSRDFRDQMAGFVFADDGDNQRPWYPDTLNKKLQRAREEVFNLFNTNETITFRSLRTFCASDIYANSLDIHEAKLVLGHASMSTTDRFYLAHNEEKLRKATIEAGNRRRRHPFADVEY
jgi:integrase